MTFSQRKETVWRGRPACWNANATPLLCVPKATEKCPAEVFFAKGEERTPAQVEVTCPGLIKNNTLEQEEALYQQYRRNQSLLSAHDLPGTCDRRPAP